jgi:hypothetical protein
MKTAKIKTADGECILTLREVKHPKSGKLVEYFSISDGLNVSGVFLGKDSKEEMYKFLKGEKKNGK